MQHGGGQWGTDLVRGGLLYNGPDYLGTDPDPNIRFQILRDDLDRPLRWRQRTDPPMFHQLLAGGLVSFFNFGIHAVMTGIIVVVTRHVAGRTDDLHVFMRLTALLIVTMIVLMAAHVVEIAVWAAFMTIGRHYGRPTPGSFEFAFENYVALGYGDVVAGDGWRLIGPIMALNGLLLIGWSVAIIFEVMRMADVQIGRGDQRDR